MVHDAEGIVVVVVLPGTLVVVVVETVVVVALVVDVLAVVVVVRDGFRDGRTSALGSSTSNAAQRARGPVTDPQTARVRTAALARPVDVWPGAAPPASAATTPPPTTRTSATAALHNFREIPARTM